VGSDYIDKKGYSDEYDDIWLYDRVADENPAHKPSYAAHHSTSGRTFGIPFLEAINEQARKVEAVIRTLQKVREIKTAFYTVPMSKKLEGTKMYTCPMHPEIQQQGPGNCPKCGMTLEPIGDYT
jgi:rubrerythrin